MNTFSDLFQELDCGFVLAIDNDCCYTYNPHNDGDGSSYDFNPRDLAHHFADAFGYKTQDC